jgi:hypothetical protein
MKTRIHSTLSVLLALVPCLPAAALAAPDEAPVPAAAVEAPADVAPLPVYARGGLYGIGLDLAAKVGGSFGQPFGDLGASFLPEVEVGWTLPWLDRSFEVAFSAQWAAPKASGVDAADVRLPGDGVMKYDVKLSQAILTLGARYRIPVPVAWVRPWVYLGARTYLVETEVSGSAGGKPFGTNRETGTEFGVLGSVGADWFVGPGAIDVELQVGWAGLGGVVLSKANAGSMNVLVGYRFFL